MAQGMQREESEPAHKQEEPLFIKVPGYKNILQDLVGVKQILTNMKESVEVLHEVQEVKERSVEVFVENVERLNEQLADIDGQFPEIEEMDIHIAEDINEGDIDEDEVIEGAFQDLKGELEGLRNDLDQIE